MGLQSQYLVRMAALLPAKAASCPAPRYDNELDSSALGCTLCINVLYRVHLLITLFHGATLSLKHHYVLHL